MISKAAAVAALAGVLCASVAIAQPAKESLGQLAEKRGMLFGAAAGEAFNNDNAAFKAALAREFNSVVSEYSMKFGQVVPARGTYNWGPGDKLVDFAQQNKMKVRGHCLAWHKEASFLETTRMTRAEMLAALKDYALKAVGRYKGKVVQWDVANEVISNNPDSTYRDTFLFRTMGIDFVDSCFRWARQADPDVPLFYNDYWNEGMGIKSDKVYAFVKGLKERNVPIDGVGLQCHFRYDSLPTFAEMDANIKRMGRLGLQVAFTEVDYRVDLPITEAKLAKQREVYEGTLRVCLENPNCKTFILWGVTDAFTWIDGYYPGWSAPLLLDRSYKPKPAYEGMWQNLNAYFPTTAFRRDGIGGPKHSILTRADPGVDALGRPPSAVWRGRIGKSTPIFRP